MTCLWHALLRRAHLDLTLAYLEHAATTFPKVTK